MQNVRVWVMAGLAFVVGCATAGVLTSSIPPARAQTTPRWEYYCENLGGRNNAALTEQLNAVGQQGWELVLRSPQGGQWCFKRALP